MVTNNEVSVRKRKIKDTMEDCVFYTIIYVILTILLLIVGLPLIYVLSASFSSPSAVIAGKVFLFPVDFSLEGYKAVFEHKDVITGYKNSLLYLGLGTVINVVLTMCAAYPLARNDLPGRKYIMMLFTFTMIFSGGLIPNYILVNKLKMLNTVWAMVIPNAVSVYNMIVACTFIRSNIPNELLEAAQIDGCGDIYFFIKIVIPLSKAVIAVITLYYAIAHWNSYFDALIY